MRLWAVIFTAFLGQMRVDFFGWFFSLPYGPSWNLNPIVVFINHCSRPNIRLIWDCILFEKSTHSGNFMTCELLLFLIKVLSKFRILLDHRPVRFYLHHYEPTIIFVFDQISLNLDINVFCNKKWNFFKKYSKCFVLHHNIGFHVCMYVIRVAKAWHLKRASHR